MMMVWRAIPGVQCWDNGEAIRPNGDWLSSTAIRPNVVLFRAIRPNGVLFISGETTEFQGATVNEFALPSSARPATLRLDYSFFVST
eukprot:3384374-Prymnesium_polylepis.1